MPKGYKFGAICCGIREKLDLGVVISEKDANVAAIFTKNSVKAWHILFDKKQIKRGKARAILVNSGNANACNRNGMEAVIRMARACTKKFRIEEGKVLVASTGVIGRDMPIEKIERGIDKMCLTTDYEGFSRAIMTTDTRPKVAHESIDLSGEKVGICAIAKGAGMISPKMATFLCFILTDVAISNAMLKRALIEGAEPFNRMSVDGEMSTNDTVIILANEMAGNRRIEEKNEDYCTFVKALHGVCERIAEMVVADGEGATKVAEIRVKGAASMKDAERACRAIANSPLFKTALHGADPNWGRMVCAIGYSGARFRKIDIAVNGIPVVRNCISTGNERAFRSEMKKKRICVEVNLGCGKYEYEVITCDLSRKYIDINAIYTT